MILRTPSFYKNFKNATGKTPAIYLSEKNK